MIAGQVSKPLLSVRSEMNAELRGEDKAATSDSELNEPLLAPVESNDSEDTPSIYCVFMLIVLFLGSYVSFPKPRLKSKIEFNECLHYQIKSFK